MTEQPQGIDLKPRMVELLTHRFEYIKSFSGEPMQLIKYIYKTADILYREQVKPAAACPTSGGCAHCCRVPVQITAFEAHYINKKTGAAINDLKIVSQHQPDNSDCPFLKKSMCSIYEFRPLNCRAFASMDSPDYCAQGGDVEHWISKIESLQSMVFLSDLLMRLSEDSKYATFADIRHWFGAEKINIKNI